MLIKIESEYLIHVIIEIHRYQNSVLKVSLKHHYYFIMDIIVEFLVLVTNEHLQFRYSTKSYHSNTL